AARDDALRRPKRNPAAAERIRGAIRRRRRRARVHRVRLQLSRRRPDAATGGARQRLPAHAGAAARVCDLRDRREFHHGPPQLRPRPARSRRLMSQLQPIIEQDAVPLSDLAPRRLGRLRVPGWLALMLANPKSRFGLALVGFMVLIAVIAPWISVSNPTDFNLLAARQAPSWHHLFGTTDQGSDIFSQVVLGTRRSLILGAAAALLATALAATLGIVAAYSGGIVDEVVNFLTNVFLVIPTIPLLIVISSYLKAR